MSCSQQSVVKDIPKMEQKDTEVSTTKNVTNIAGVSMSSARDQVIQGFKEFMNDFYQVSISIIPVFSIANKGSQAWIPKIRKTKNVKTNSKDLYYPIEHSCQHSNRTVTAFECIHILRSLALVMGLELTFFDSALKTADPQLRIIHYIPVSQRIISSRGHARINPHTDFGLCTLLFQNSVGGLEVDPFHTRKFVPATLVKGTCIINVADLIELHSNDN
jgi:hypothetical protein